MPVESACRFHKADPHVDAEVESTAEPDSRHSDSQAHGLVISLACVGATISGLASGKRTGAINLELAWARRPVRDSLRAIQRSVLFVLRRVRVITVAVFINDPTAA